jgi:phosphoserine phosphatase
MPPVDTVGSADPAAPPPVVAADLEGTCTAGETWRGVGRWLGANGRRGRYRRFLAPRLAALPLVRVGLVSRRDFRNRWIRDLARLLDGLTPGELEAMAAEVVKTELWPKRRPAVIAELESATAGGARVVIATGTYDPVLAAFAARVEGGPAWPVSGLGTPLAMRDGRTTGRLAGPIGTGAPKAVRVRAFAAGAPILAAYGDSLADVPLLEAAESAVAVAPDAELRPLAAARGWRILDAPAGDP